jgi:hypothetical protein
MLAAPTTTTTPSNDIDRAVNEVTEKPAFTFREMPPSATSLFAANSKSDGAVCLTQWHVQPATLSLTARRGLKDTMWCRTFSFNEPLAAYQTESFLIALFKAAGIKVPFRSSLK